MAALYGDVPFSQAVQPDEYPNPVYDSQSEVVNGGIALIEQGIAKVGTASIAAGFGGNRLSGGTWAEAAHTLAARYSLLAGNYAAAFYPTKLAIKQGFQQIIWTDSNNHNAIEEAGTMNLFFVIGDKLITSPTSDSILDGITRKSIIELAKFHNIDVLEREITIDEILKEHKSGNLKEIFGSGTAVVVLPIKSFGHRDQLYTLSSEKSSVSSFLKEKLNNIQYNISNEFKNWKFKIN